MRDQVSMLTQSKFYSPVFNSAIFDGAIRIYFSQKQEASALKLYFAAMKRFKDELDIDSNIFILIYPNAENFELVFGQGQETTVAIEKLDGDFVIGLNGPINEDEFETLFDRIESLVTPSLVAPAPAAEA